MSYKFKHNDHLVDPSDGEELRIISAFTEDNVDYYVVLYLASSYRSSEMRVHTAAHLDRFFGPKKKYEVGDIWLSHDGTEVLYVDSPNLMRRVNGGGFGSPEGYEKTFGPLVKWER